MYSTGALANDFVIIIIFLKHEAQSRLYKKLLLAKFWKFPAK